MNKRMLINVVASGLMVLAHLFMPLWSMKVKVMVIGIVDSASMFRTLTETKNIFWFLVLLLLLLVPIYLLLDIFREKIPFMKKVVIPSKVATLLPLVLSILITFDLLSVPDMVEIELGFGYYIYLLAAIVVAVLPWVNHAYLGK